MQKTTAIALNRSTTLCRHLATQTCSTPNKSQPSKSEFTSHPWLSELGLAQHNNGCFTGSQWQGSGPKWPALNPATNQVIATVQVGTKSDYEACIKQMSRIKPLWSALPAPARGEIVRQIADALRLHKQSLGRLISLEMGKIEAEGLGEVQEAIDICDYASSLSRSLFSSVIPSERPEHFMMERFLPLQGHVGIISAFNFPCAVYFWNLALSLIVGNTNIWKGSDSTNLVSIACLRIVQDVLRRQAVDYSAVATLITGKGADVGEALIHDPRIELVSFTGSTAVGRHVSQVTATRFAKKILELGGNNAMLVDSDADHALALRAAVFSAVGTAGQRCTTLRRLYVHAEVYDEFVAKLVKAYAGVPIGDPLDKSTLCGPLHNKHAVQLYTDAIARAQQQGGKVLVGGKVLSDRPGNFVQPTLIEMSDTSASCIQHETFVPLLYVMKYKNLQEGIRLNNSVPQGLSSSLFTRNQHAVFEWTGPSGSDCGIVNVNIGPSGAEIGGAFGGEKETGGGRESGSDAWKQYCRRATCTINHSTKLPLAQGITFDI